MNNLKEKIQKDFEIGKKAETEFIEVVEKNGYYCLTSSSKEDHSEHWDVRLIKNPLDLYIDVKKEKEATFKYDCTWLELKNVDGDIGWLYASKLNAVAFKRKGKFYVVAVEPLRELIEEKVKDKLTFYYDKKDDYIDLKYKKYMRVNWGRRDVAVLTPFSDILPHTIMTFDIN